MNDIWKHVLDLYGELPDWAKLASFLPVVFLAIWLGVRKALADRELNAKQQELDEVTKERDDLLKRKNALDQIDTYVWLKPAAESQNRFMPSTDRKTRFVAICNLKGGVAKTTLTLNLGGTLARLGKRVLLVDLDFQSSLSKLALAQTQLDECCAKRWCTDTLLKTDFNDDVRRWIFTSNDMAECRVMPARPELELVEYEQQSRFYLNPQHEVRFLLQRLLHAAPIVDAFDYVFFDCPPRMSTACINALTCADYILIPTTLSPLDVEAAPRTLRWHLDLHAIVRATFLGVVVTGCRMRGGKLTKTDDAQLGRLKKTILPFHPASDPVFQAMIPDSPVINRVTTEGKVAAIHSKEGRAWFEGVEREFERKVRS